MRNIQGGPTTEGPITLLSMLEIESGARFVAMRLEVYFGTTYSYVVIMQMFLSKIHGVWRYLEFQCPTLPPPTCRQSKSSNGL